MRRQPPEVRDSDRFAAAAYMVDQLNGWMAERNRQRAAALPDEPAWSHWASSDGGIRSEAPDSFPGRRSAWVRQSVFDSGLRRKAQRQGREKGCWVYVPAEALKAAGVDPDGPPPHYRTWAGRGGSVLVRLYRER